MFGDNTNDNANGQQPFAGSQPTLNTPLGAAPDMSAMSAPAVPATDNQPASDQQQPAASQPEVTSYGATDNHAQDATPATDAAAPADDATTAPAVGGGSEDLLDIKQQALQQLTPLVDHLEQTPKEEFRTTMMMIQATDNQELIKKAFEAAQKIEDDKERAQAFLDIINEINYFTQHHE